MSRKQILDALDRKFSDLRALGDTLTARLGEEATAVGVGLLESSPRQIAAEAGAGLSTGIARTVDFATTDFVNNILTVLGSDVRIPSLESLNRKVGGEGGFMAPGIARNVVRGTTQVIPEMANDAYGLLADINMFVDDPESRTLLNGLLSGLGVLPFVPNAAMFLGVRNPLADLEMQKVAEEMQKRGADKYKIWQDTGWMQEPHTGDWKFEISDHEVELDLPHTRKGTPVKHELSEKMQGRAAIPIEEAMPHPELQQAYSDLPMLRDDQYFPLEGARGRYYGSNDTLQISGDLPKDEATSTGLHELQHAVQKREGFATGGNPSEMALEKAKALKRWNAYSDAWQIKTELEKGRPITEIMDDLRELDMMPEDAALNLSAEYSAEQLGRLKDRAYDELLQYGDSTLDPSGYEAYKKLAGEVESRNVQARMKMTPEERRIIPPWETQDVPYEQQIVRRRGGEMASDPRLARAREQGFDTDQVWYHGTDSDDFDAFDLDMSGQNSDAPRGIFLTESPEHAATYGENVHAVYVRRGETETVDWGGRGWDGSGPDDFDDYYNINERAAEAREWRGADTFEAQNIIDEGPKGQGYSWGEKTLVVFDPKDIRSINAQFDPAKKDSANLLAGVAGGGVALGAATAAERQKEREKRDLATALSGVR